jgi:hypothetical protein
MPISKINFFQPGIWENGALIQEIERNLAAPVDLFASGQWKPALTARIFEKYKDILRGSKGRDVERFDPAGYLSEVGLAQSLTAGRSNSDVLRTFHLIKAYHPDARYFPFSKKTGALVQKIFLSISRISISAAIAVDRLIDPLAVKMTEKKYRTDQYRSAPYGKFEEIVKGEQSNLSKEARYLGVLRKKVPQFAWDRGPHSGSIDPDRRANEDFGTYDIAVKFGFSKEQTRRMAAMCYDVDINQTHYHDPGDRSKLRITGTVGEIGDIQRHYNRSPAGVEDTRITAARIHLDRALRLADDGFYDAAEQELGIGLHSLQDIFSHAQLTPTTHTCLGEFPDLVKYHPLSLFETAVATEGYFKKFIAGLNLKPLGPAPESQAEIQFPDPFIGGTAAAQDQALVSQKTAAFPEKLATFLKDNGIRIFVGAKETLPTELGFGVALDGDGKVSPGKWVDVNRDGQKQWFEVEDQFDAGKTWDRQPAAYNHQNRTIFISARVIKESGLELQAVLKHEINHALDLTLQGDPRLNAKWTAYINKLYHTARRQGTIAFDELDPHEYFARIDLT